MIAETGTLIDSYASLPANIAANAPWVTEGGANLFPEKLQGSVAELLEGSEDNRLTIVTDEGKVYEKYQPLAITKGKIKIGKPSGWKDCPSSFHVFFKNSNGKWNFFLAGKSVCSPAELLIDPPEKVMFLQRRRYKRIATPTGTKTMFKDRDNRVDDGYIQDISEAGMLIHINTAKDEYPLDSNIHEIFINLPAKIKRDLANITCIITPLISSGKVVRNIYDQEHSRFIYGISFSYDSDYAKDSIRRLAIYLESLVTPKVLSQQ